MSLLKSFSIAEYVYSVYRCSMQPCKQAAPICKNVSTAAAVDPQCATHFSTLQPAADFDCSEHQFQGRNVIYLKVLEQPEAVRLARKVLLVVAMWPIPVALPSRTGGATAAAAAITSAAISIAYKKAAVCL
jgi:hypothetical protein